VDPATLDASAVGGYLETSHEVSLTGFLPAIIPATLPSPSVGGIPGPEAM